MEGVDRSKKRKARAMEEEAKLQPFTKEETEAAIAFLINYAKTRPDVNETLKPEQKKDITYKKRMKKTFRLWRNQDGSTGITCLTNLKFGNETWNIELIDKEIKKSWEEEDLVASWCTHFGLTEEQARALYKYEHKTFKTHKQEIVVKKGGVKKTVDAGSLH